MANNSLTIKVVFTNGETSNRRMSDDDNEREQQNRSEKRKSKLKEATNSPDADNGPEDETSADGSEDDRTGKRSQEIKKMAKAIGVAAVQVVSKVAGEVIDAGINSLSTFDMKIEQQKMNNAKSIMNRGVSAYSTIAVGTAFGGVVGGVAAAISVALNEVVNMAQRNMEWQTNQRMYDAETQRQSARLDEVTTSAGRHIKL